MLHYHPHDASGLSRSLPFFSFINGIDGANPNALVQGSDGIFYGKADFGGISKSNHEEDAPYNRRDAIGLLGPPGKGKVKILA
jgi:hypothetical protein